MGGDFSIEGGFWWNTSLPDSGPWFFRPMKPFAKFMDRSLTPINCTRSTFVLDGEKQTSADIVDEFADDHEVWAHAFIEGWQAIQKNGYDDNSLNDGPKSSWLGYSLLPEGSPIEFPLLFTENPNFNITSYLAKDEATGCFGMLGC